MVYQNGGLRFTPIPHFSITEILDRSSILIVEDNSGYELDPDTDSPAYKYRKTDAGPSSVELDEPVTPVQLCSELKTELPTALIDVFEFKDEVRQLNERLDLLRQQSLALKANDMRTKFPEASMPDLITLCRVRTETGLSRSLRRPIRCPTITEVIWSAAKLNVQHVLALNRSSGVTNVKRLDLSVDEKTNVWSENNLCKVFAAQVDLESYQLVIGAKQYVHGEKPSNSASGRPWLVQGPQNNSSPSMFHRNATDCYLQDHGGATLSLIPDNEVILTVSLYHGVRGHKLREYDMLSSQTLSELRDAFHCPCEIHPVDHDLELKGSCFMLNGQLFPDFRNDACDYAEPLLHFFGSYKPGILSTMECIEQSDAIVGQLDVPVYSPGFLLHHGDCEHRVMITAIRVFDKMRDCPYVQCYPVCVFTPRKRFVQCSICEQHEATKSVFNTPVLPHIPSYLCDDCYDCFARLGTPGGIYRSDGLAQTAALVFCED